MVTHPYSKRTYVLSRHLGTNQQWNINTNGTITGVQSGLCLDVTNAATTNGTPVELYTCNSGTNQKWTF